MLVPNAILRGHVATVDTIIGRLQFEKDLASRELLRRAESLRTHLLAQVIDDQKRMVSATDIAFVEVPHV